MTKGKPIPKRKERFVKTTSKKTGAKILIVTVALLVFVSAFMFLAIQESDRINKAEKDWRLQSCEDMKKDYVLDPLLWKRNAIIDKGCKI